jgi:6-pyruvoyl-tetrahydropterin synthase
MHEYKKYVNELLDSEEMKFYLDNFGFKKNPTVEKIKGWTKQQLLEEVELINSKSSSLSKKERDLVIYFASKIK